MEPVARGRVRQVSISAVKTRADGTIEDLGVIGYWHRKPLKRWAWALKRGLRNWLSW